MKVLITGSQGFIGSYICKDLLDHGYEVVGVDNFSKYGVITRPHDNHPNFKLYDLDVLHPDFSLVFHDEKPEMIIAGAAMIGGISYFHKYAYDLLAQNERMMANTFDLAIEGYELGWFKRIIVMSSSMVYENTNIYPTPEQAVLLSPPPSSTYGFQKLACEYFARGAYQQYGLPFSIVRPFNCVGVGEEDAIGDHEVTSGNVKLMMSHVLPDLVNKIMKGQNPVHILGCGDQVRCYTNGKDLARGIRFVMESNVAENNDFNISTPISTTVLELAEMIWNKLNPGQPFEHICDTGYEFDVQMRVPDISKAKRLLGFETVVTLEESVDEVIKYMKEKNAINSSPWEH